VQNAAVTGTADATPDRRDLEHVIRAARVGDDTEARQLLLGNVEALAEVTEQDLEQGTLEDIPHQKVIQVADQQVLVFIITTEALEAVVLHKQVEQHRVLT